MQSYEVYEAQVVWLDALLLRVENNSYKSETFNWLRPNVRYFWLVKILRWSTHLIGYYKQQNWSLTTYTDYAEVLLLKHIIETHWLVDIFIYSTLLTA